MLLQGKRIFYIEDDSKNRAVVQMILENAGARIEFERWGFSEIAIPKVKAFHADLILLDLMFPMNITGYDIYDAIRRHFVLENVPIVAISASDPAIEIPKTQAKGFAGFIAKPVNMHDLPQQLVSVLEGQHVWHAG
jgi:CheY-like chemotaxis protein